MVTAYSGVCIELWAVTGEGPSRKSTDESVKIGDPTEELMKKTSSCSKLSTDSRMHPEQNFRKTHIKEAQVRKQVQ